MGFFSQRYIPHCCLVYITKKKNYLTKIIKCDEQSIIIDVGSINIFIENPIDYFWYWRRKSLYRKRKVKY